MSFLEELARRQIINRDEISTLTRTINETDETAESLLLKKGISEDTLMQIKGEYLDMPVRSIEVNDVPVQILNYIPGASARHYHFVPINIVDGVLEIGITDPDNIEAMDALQFISTRIKMPFKVYLISEDDFGKIVEKYDDAPTDNTPPAPASSVNIDAQSSNENDAIDVPEISESENIQSESQQEPKDRQEVPFPGSQNQEQGQAQAVENASRQMSSAAAEEGVEIADSQKSAQEDLATQDAEREAEVALSSDDDELKSITIDDDASRASENTAAAQAQYQAEGEAEEEMDSEDAREITPDELSGVGESAKNSPNIDGVDADLGEADTEKKDLRSASMQQNLQKELKDAAQGKNTQSLEGAGDESGESAPVSKMVAVILRHATEGGASDIHVEHTGKKIRVRFRIDGELHTSILLPKNVHAAMVSRIKILANLRLDEKRKPQDGRFSAKIDDRRIDFRVSTYPAYYGEKVVMRILDSEKGIKSIADLGLRKEDYEKIQSAIKRPYGMILLTGPTGSGKSTTLYSMLQELDVETDNIVSLEDPIEYHIDGVNQSNVRPEIGYTFADGLRSILRQDPDVIMVGEIRDKETAELAIQAALTGHLVFSTLHTNSAAGVVPRLIDMGIDPYLIAPTLIMAIGQRLSHKLCEGAAKPVEIDEAMQKMIDEEFSDLPDEYKEKLNLSQYEHVHEAKPTDACPSGVRGRQAVFEIFEVNKNTRSTILGEPVESEVFQAARKDGMLTMREDAILKTFQGVIPYVEVNKL